MRCVRNRRQTNVSCQNFRRTHPIVRVSNGSTLRADSSAGPLWRSRRSVFGHQLARLCEVSLRAFWMESTKSIAQATVAARVPGPFWERSESRTTV